MLIDSHCHIHLPDFDSDRQAVLKRAQANDIETLIIVGNDHASNQDLIRLLPEFSDHKITLGIHPHHCHEWNSEVLSWIKKQLHLPQVVAIGETGLDYFRNPHPVLLQEKVMRAQIELALEYSLPVVFHIRDAFADARRVLQDYPSLRFVMHCFTGTVEDVEWIVKLGGFISLSGIVTFANAKSLQAAAQQIPLDHLLVETDAPFLAPGQFRGQRCEPAFLSETVEKLAELRGLSVKELSQVLYLNTKIAFGFANNAK